MNKRKPSNTNSFESTKPSGKGSSYIKSGSFSFKKPKAKKKSSVNKKRDFESTKPLSKKRSTLDKKKPFGEIESVPQKKLIYSKRGVFEVTQSSKVKKEIPSKSPGHKPKNTLGNKKREFSEITADQLGTSLSKFIALAGVCSRRKAAEIIKEGSVTINDKVITEPGRKVGQNDVVRAFGKLVAQEEKVYVLLNKPKDYITTVSDEKGRKTVMELILPDIQVRLYPIGRLDRATTGLLILTNDGDLALKLSHPRYEVRKTYHVTLNKPVAQGDLSKMVHDGVDLKDEIQEGHIKVDAAAYVPGSGKKEIMVELHSGKYRVVRRMFEALGYDVRKLDRVGYAGLTKQGLRSGAWRHLDQREVNMLKKLGKK